MTVHALQVANNIGTSCKKKAQKLFLPITAPAIKESRITTVVFSLRPPILLCLGLFTESKNAGK